MYRENLFARKIFHNKFSKLVDASSNKFIRKVDIAIIAITITCLSII